MTTPSNEPNGEGEAKATELLQYPSLNAEGAEPGLNLEGLDSDDSVDDVEVSKVEADIAPEERHEVLVRQIETQCKLATQAQAAAAKTGK